jgi:hypothetical protein
LTEAPDDAIGAALNGTFTVLEIMGEVPESRSGCFARSCRSRLENRSPHFAWNLGRLSAMLGGLRIPDKRS